MFELVLIKIDRGEVCSPGGWVVKLSPDKSISFCLTKKHNLSF